LSSLLLAQRDMKLDLALGVDMYKVRYYTNTDQLLSKMFGTLGEAVDFTIQRVHTGNLYGIDKI